MKTDMLLCATLQPYCILRYFAPEARFLGENADLSRGISGFLKNVFSFTSEGQLSAIFRRTFLVVLDVYKGLSILLPKFGHELDI